MKIAFSSLFLALIVLSCCGEPHDDAEQLSEVETESLSTVVAHQEAFDHKTPITSDFLQGKFTAEEHPDFIEIDIDHASRAGMLLQKEAYDAFVQMYQQAEKEDIKLQIRSATRNFDAQKSIWEDKWLGKRPSAGKNALESYPDPIDRANNILLYSSMPGTSRHHWGTDIDLNSFDNQWFSEGEGLILYNWLQERAADFGFCQPYTELGENRTTGYQEEKWHWSYLPLAVPYTLAAKKLLSNEDISGFLGSETAVELDIVTNYVLGLNPDCKINDPKNHKTK